MKQYFGYTRVSTAKQGEKGVSLQEQHDAILRYGERQGLHIVSWFEERVTAAKRGRPVFNQMLKLLRQGKADGIIIHKIDRSARNLKDWADLGELIDHGIQVLFVNETLDMQSRGGRLSADIQAVVAADFVRNLREEAKKGLYGRLKQGIYPWPAPLGYVNCGKGRTKEPNPVTGPLVRTTFELYATGRYNLDGLSEEMHRRGLRNRRSNRVTRNGCSTLLNNPFYIGLIQLKLTGETFPGAHQPLIPKSLFDRVQAVLTGKTNTRTQRHDFLFRRLVTCAHCGHSLIAETQKGHTYYRCHGSTCPLTCVREEAIETALMTLLMPLEFCDDEKSYLRDRLMHLRANWTKDEENATAGLNLQFSQVTKRLDRLTDALLDGLIDKATFEERKNRLLFERKGLEEKQNELRNDGSTLPDRITEFLELAGRTWLSYQMGNTEEKRELLRIVTSNRRVDGKKLEFELSNPFSEVARRHENTNGDPIRDIPRTLDTMINQISTFVKSNTVPTSVSQGWVDSR